jgi:predicted RNA-binding protein with PUA-like domain
MAYWLLKTEPTTYSWDDLVREGTTIWDGVANNAALKHMRAMQVGDEALIYHSGDVRAAVGLARISKAAYQDPQKDDPKAIVVDVEALRPLARPVTLGQIKAEPALASWALVREARLSVMPCSPEQWQWMLEPSA